MAFYREWRTQYSTEYDVRAKIAAKKYEYEQFYCKVKLHLFAYLKKKIHKSEVLKKDGSEQFKNFVVRLFASP